MQVSCVETTESQELFHKNHMSIYVVKNLIFCTILSLNYKGLLNIGVLFVYVVLQ